MSTITAQDHFDEVITDQSLSLAIEQGVKRKNKGLHATLVKYLPAFKSLLIGFVDESAVVLPLKNYPEFADLSLQELEQLHIGFGGSALCLDKHDLHVSIAGLVSASQPLMEMATSVVAAHNGRRSSLAKATASRANGHKGGRPRKLLATG